MYGNQSNCRSNGGTTEGRGPFDHATPHHDEDAFFHDVLSADYLRAIAAELNDVGAEVYNSLVLEDDDEKHDEVVETVMGLYKEAATTRMEAVESGEDDAPQPRRAELRSKRRLKMIVAAKEMLLEERKEQRSDAREANALRDVMFSDPISVCDVGQNCLARAVKARDDRGDFNDDAVASATLCNIGILQLHRGRSECDDSLLESAAKLFRMSLAASEEAAKRRSGGLAGLHRITARNNLGHSFYLQGRFDEAVECFREALSELKNGISPSSQHCDVHQVNFHGITAMPIGLSSAQRTPATAPASSDGGSSWHGSARKVLLCNIGRTLHTMGDIEGAFQACMEAMELCLLQDGPEVEVEVAAISVALFYNLGLFYEEQGLPDQALKCYRKFIDRAPVTASSGIVMCLTRILLLEFRKIQPRNAKVDEVVNVLRHLQQIRADMGHDHPALASVLRCIGSALSELEENKHALPFLLESLRIERAVHEEKVTAGALLGSDVVVAINAVGQCYHSLNRPEHAAKHYEEARKIRERHMDAMLRATVAGTGDRTPDSVRFIFAVTLYNGGRVHFDLGRREDSGRFFDDALDQVGRIAARSEARGDGAKCHLAECSSLQHNIGQYKMELGRTTDALHCFEGALRIRRSVLPRDHPAVAETLYQLGRLYHRMGDTARALKSFTETLRIDRAAHGNDHPSVAMTLYNMAHIFHDMRELERALDFFKGVLTIITGRDADCEEEALSTSNILGWIGTIQGDMGLVQEARLTFEESLQAAGSGANLRNSALFANTVVELADLRPAAAA